MGEVFAGRYELVDPVGRGGIGAVWRAWDHRRRRYVAAKVLQQSDAHTLIRFVREQAVRIDHPHVIAPASWAADDDKVLFTMDLVAGGSLAHLIGDHGPLPERYVCVLLDQLLAGVAAVHAEGIVHRDIKPANILLEATGTARPHLRLSDFGISMRKGEPRLTETNYVVGTPGYFAPEQMLGAEPDFPADLFAVGLTALHLLEGRKPDAKALVEYFAEHGTPHAPEGISEPLWQVLAGLLQPHPHTRFRTATGARKALASAVELLPHPAPDEHPVEILDRVGPLPPGFGSAGPSAPVDPRAPRTPHAPPPQPVPQPPPPSVPPVAASVTDGFPLSPPVVPPRPAYAPDPTPPTAPTAPGEALPGPEQAAGTPAPYEGPPDLPAPPTVAEGDPGTPTPTPAGTPPPSSPDRSEPLPHAARPSAPHSAPSRTPAHAARSTARFGPPARVAVPVLLLALLCFAVGFWALGTS